MMRNAHAAGARTMMRVIPLRAWECVLVRRDDALFSGAMSVPMDLARWRGTI
jgi:hypothetical protein